MVPLCGQLKELSGNSGCAVPTQKPIWAQALWVYPGIALEVGRRRGFDSVTPPFEPGCSGRGPLRARFQPRPGLTAATFVGSASSVSF